MHKGRTTTLREIQRLSATLCSLRGEPLQRSLWRRQQDLHWAQAKTTQYSTYLGLQCRHFLS